MSDVKITDKSKECLAAFISQLKPAMWAIGAAAEGHAKDKTPVDTGNLRNSITHEETDSAVYIGSAVEYAPYVELGSSHNKAHHMLRDAAQNHTEEYKKIIEAALKS